MNYKAVFFDFDYTLGDSTEGIIQSVNHGLNRLGYEKANSEEIRKTIGHSLHRTYEMLTGKDSSEEADKFAAFFKEKADDVMVANTTLFSDAEDVLLNLKARGLKLAIVTTKYHYRIKEILGKCGLPHVFDLIVGSDDVNAPKPDPEGILKAMNQLKLKPWEILYVGDSLVDAETSEAAGTAFAAVTTGSTPAEEFQSFPNAGIFSNLSELIEMIR